MKTVFVNRFFFPDHSATSQILSELAFELASRGHEVHVVTSRQLYDRPSTSLPYSEAVANVTIHRVWSTRFGRGNLLGRSVDYLTFYIGALIGLVSILGKGDVVVAKTDPPLVSIVASIAAKLKRSVLVNWLQDLFPEAASRLGITFAKGLPGAIALRLRNRSLRSAAANVAIGERMAATLRAAGIPRTTVIHNWAVGASRRELHVDLGDLRGEWGLGEQFIVAYSGNLGRAHEFATIVGAIDLLKQEEEIVFAFIGGGNQVGALHLEIERRGLSASVRFLPYQPLDRLQRSLASANVHLVSLQPDLEGCIVPSKFYGIAAAERPTIFIGDTDGEIAQMIGRFDCGFVVHMGDAKSLAEHIRTLRGDPSRCSSMGRNARLAHERHFSREVALERWLEVLGLAAGSRDESLDRRRRANLGNPS